MWKRTLFICAFIPLVAVAASSNTADMTSQSTASGSFEIKLRPCEDSAFEAGRMTIDKVYQGQLVGTGKGQMLSTRTKNPGSAGYVAMEFFEGTLDGVVGGFALQHTGLMTRGEPSLSVVIVPDSGTGELAGIAGVMTIDQSSGEHLYELSYSIEQPSISED